mmetsp:Transcript_14695/g.20411  ORF Transcript_14695/g.20411 Transcript_14695/m.20411 type:complete len:223 (+) Transcript_14695:120-788(+)|eukprot:CAMPEP_0185265392 /NCGR_PEP_ID=MMETSP1359-20130426/27375_1 /TAXON_ID=552665 /ORGANISM="Bigelowiella longifila, Strain CCMP242" /LENGTH=222 /DNA_ID=CAMNT_0027854623 /DNA_START=38 /DNA_END=706 /DNA_ORIENTATION=-
MSRIPENKERRLPPRSEGLKLIRATLRRWLGLLLGNATRLLYYNPTVDTFISHASSPVHVLYLASSVASLSAGYISSRDVTLHTHLESMGLTFESRMRAKISMFLLGLLGSCYLLGKMCREPLSLASIRLARITSPVQSEIAVEERSACRSSLEMHLYGDLIFLVLEYLGDTEAEIQRIAIGEIVQDTKENQSSVAERLRSISRLCDDAVASIWDVIRMSLR